VATVIYRWVDTVREAAVYNPNTQAEPAVVLWPDKECQWQPVVKQLQEVLPELLVLGELNAEQLTGPAIWLKCVIAKTLDTVVLPEDLTPVIYLPGISRAELRDVVNCPGGLKPLAELQYRGAMLSQYSGKDWTLNAFLTSGSFGLGLDVAQDKGTQKAMLMALGELLNTDISSIENRRLEASDFNQLLTSDPIKDLLIWMNSPDQTRERLGDSRWRALCNETKREYHLDIEGDGVFSAAEKLCAAEGKWQQVWQRFVDTSDAYPALPELLSRVDVPDMFADVARYPQANKIQEKELLIALQGIVATTPTDARKAIEALDRQHGARRHDLWAKLGESPWALLLEPLTNVAVLTQKTLGGLSPQELGQHYEQGGWQTDHAALQCIRQCDSKQQKDLIVELLSVIYTPWLADLNERFQQHVAVKGYPGGASKADSNQVNEAVAAYKPSGECIFFVDGLRLDVAHQLMELLSSRGISPSLKTQWSALPSVTATAKAAVSPIADKLTGLATDSDFEPSVIDGGGLSHDRFKRTLGKFDWQYLEEDDIGDPSGNAWTACGDIDKEGHKSELKLPSRILPILDAIVDRIQELQQSGWQKIRIVTDHGWLLVPGTMPKIDLPVQAAESRWGRCAQLKPSVHVDGLTLGWYWNANTAIHFPPGIHSFIAGRSYSHGGVSLQECLIPVITIEGEVKKLAQASIDSVRWLGLTCKVEVESQSEGLRIDLRTKLADSDTSLVNSKAVKNGKCSLMVSDDDNEGLQAMVVVLDADGNVLAKYATTIGGDE
jgi:hypothetical protein